MARVNKMFNAVGNGVEGQEWRAHSQTYNLRCNGTFNNLTFYKLIRMQHSSYSKLLLNLVLEGQYMITLIKYESFLYLQLASSTVFPHNFKLPESTDKTSFCLVQQSYIF